MINLSVLLTNISTEADRLAQIAQRLDDMVGALAASDRTVAKPLPADFQDIDALRQALHALKQITASAAAEIPQGADVQLPKAALAAGVNLEKVRDACLRTENSVAVSLHANALATDASDKHAFFDEF